MWPHAAVHTIHVRYSALRLVSYQAKFQDCVAIDRHKQSDEGLGLILYLIIASGNRHQAQGVVSLGILHITR